MVLLLVAIVEEQMRRIYKLVVRQQLMSQVLIFQRLLAVKIILFQQSTHASIGGGDTNAISANANHSVISGGQLNTIVNANSAIAGGENNTILGNTNHSMISGGEDNSIMMAALIRVLLLVLV